MSAYPTEEEIHTVKTTMNQGPTKRRFMNKLKVASTACFHSSVLRPWMKTYAEWMALQPGRLGRKERTKVANKLAKDKVSQRALQFLEKRADFLAYHDRFAAGAVSQARAKLEAESPWYVEQHRRGLERAIKAKDYKAITNFTTPVLERVWPRREGSVIATQVTIHLSPRQQTELSQSEPQLLPAEIVPEPEPPTE